MAKRHKAQWFIDLLRKTEGNADERALAKALAEDGQCCIGLGNIRQAKDAAEGTKTTEEFLDNFEKVFPILQRDGDKVYIVFHECFCGVMKGFKGEVPESYCYCSVGWVKEMFEQALERPVEVKLESAVLRGDPECRLRVIL